MEINPFKSEHGHNMHFGLGACSNFGSMLVNSESELVKVAIRYDSAALHLLADPGAGVGQRISIAFCSFAVVG